MSMKIIENAFRIEKDGDKIWPIEFSEFIGPEEYPIFRLKVGQGSYYKMFAENKKEIEYCTENEIPILTICHRKHLSDWPVFTENVNINTVGQIEKLNIRVLRDYMSNKEILTYKNPSDKEEKLYIKSYFKEKDYCYKVELYRRYI